MLRLVKRYLKPYALQAALAIVMVLMQVLVELALPTINAQITNELIGAQPSMTVILQKGGVMLLLVLLMGVAATLAGFFSARSSMGFGRDMRAAVFERVEEFSSANMNRFGAPSLITRTTNDVQQVQMAAMMFMRMMAMAPLMCMGGVVMAVRQDKMLSLVVVAALPLIGVVMGVMITRGMPYFTSMQKRIDRINRVLREKLTGMRVIRAFNREEDEQARFDEANTDLRQVSVRVGRLMGTMMPCLMIILNLTTVGILFFGVRRVNTGSLDVGSVQAFINYASMILMSLTMMSMLFIMLPRAQASAERILEVLDTKETILDGDKTVRASGKASGVLAFEDVSFCYPGAQENVLEHIDFSACPGQTLAIIGGTGCGKSTLISLIARLYDVTRGRITLSGMDIREMTQAALRASIGYVPQKAFLFSGTIRDNLLDGKRDATDEQMWEALAVAQAEDFVRALPEGLDAPVAQGGTNFSGGQRQRLCIARALVRKAQVYVFDDSFSALDFKTDAALRAALLEKTQDALKVIIAQRVTTIKNADRILVMDEGRVVGAGTHAQLLADCEVYQQIAYSQLTKEEMAS